MKGKEKISFGREHLTESGIPGAGAPLADKLRVHCWRCNKRSILSLEVVKVQLIRGGSCGGSRNPKGRIKTPLPYTVRSKDMVSCLLLEQNRRYTHYVM